MSESSGNTLTGYLDEFIDVPIYLPNGQRAQKIFSSIIPPETSPLGFHTPMEAISSVRVPHWQGTVTVRFFSLFRIFANVIVFLLLSLMIYFLPGPSYLPSPLIKNIFSGHKKRADLPFKPENQPSNIHFGGSNPSSTPHASLKPHTLFRGIKMPRARSGSGLAVCASFKTTLYGRWGLKRCRMSSTLQFSAW